MYPPNRHLSAKVRAFVDWTAELFQRDPTCSGTRRNRRAAGALILGPMNSAPPTEHTPPQKQWGAHHRAPPPAHPPAGAAPAKQARNPLHGITLEAMVVGLPITLAGTNWGGRFPSAASRSTPAWAPASSFAQNPVGTREGREPVPLHAARTQAQRLKTPNPAGAVGQGEPGSR